MDFFTSTEMAALKDKSSVRYAVLAHLEFKSVDMRIRLGIGEIVAGGYSWGAIGEIVSIDGLADQRGTDSVPVTFTISGVDTKFLPIALNDTSEVDQQPITLYLQLLDELDQPIGRLITIFYGLMQPPTIVKSYTEVGWICTISLVAENILAGKAKPPYARYTDSDQQSRYRGDNFCKNVNSVRNKTITWPNY